MNGDMDKDDRLVRFDAINAKQRAVLDCENQLKRLRKELKALQLAEVEARPLFDAPDGFQTAVLDDSVSAWQGTAVDSVATGSVVTESLALAGTATHVPAAAGKIRVPGRLKTPSGQPAGLIATDQPGAIFGSLTNTIRPKESSDGDAGVSEDGRASDNNGLGDLRASEGLPASLGRSKVDGKARSRVGAAGRVSVPNAGRGKKSDSKGSDSVSKGRSRRSGARGNLDVTGKNQASI